MKRSALERTAYHEAGHVIACLATGRKFRYVTIIRKDDARGYIRFCMFRNLEFATNKTLINHGITTLAGTCAEKIKFGRYSHGFGSDREHAVDSFLRAGVENVNPYFARTENLLKKHWANVERVAVALLKAKTLQFQEVNDLISHA